MKYVIRIITNSGSEWEYSIYKKFESEDAVIEDFNLYFEYDGGVLEVGENALLNDVVAEIMTMYNIRSKDDAAVVVNGY